MLQFYHLNINIYCKKVGTLATLRIRFHRISKGGKSRVIYDLCFKLTNATEVRVGWHFRPVQGSNFTLPIVSLHCVNQLNTRVGHLNINTVIDKHVFGSRFPFPSVKWSRTRFPCKHRSGCICSFPLPSLATTTNAMNSLINPSPHPKLSFSRLPSQIQSRFLSSSNRVSFLHWKHAVGRLFVRSDATIDEGEHLVYGHSNPNPSISSSYRPNKIPKSNQTVLEAQARVCTGPEQTKPLSEEQAFKVLDTILKSGDCFNLLVRNQ